MFLGSLNQGKILTKLPDVGFDIMNVDFTVKKQIFQYAQAAPSIQIQASGEATLRSSKDMLTIDTTISLLEKVNVRINTHLSFGVFKVDLKMHGKLLFAMRHL